MFVAPKAAIAKATVIAVITFLMGKSISNPRQGVCMIFGKQSLLQKRIRYLV